jgi:hypothetical protein
MNQGLQRLTEQAYRHLSGAVSSNFEGGVEQEHAVAMLEAQLRGLNYTPFSTEPTISPAVKEKCRQLADELRERLGGTTPDCFVY